MYHKRLNWLCFFAQGEKMTKSLSWLWFFAQGEKRPGLLHICNQGVNKFDKTVSINF
jgi:hypothetical protein